MSFINSIITSSLPLLPKWFAKPFAKPYVAGENSEDALQHVKQLNDKGFYATLDILGEHVMDKELAQQITSQYCKLYELIDEHALECTLSVKPTHIGLNISESEALANMSAIAKKAQEFGNFLRIDMESSGYTDQTFEILKHCKKFYGNVGVAIQAYLYRSQNDINNLSNDQFNSRICKGIYKESSTIAYRGRDDIRNNFLLLAKMMAKRGSFCGYATHDQVLIDKLLEWIQDENIAKHLFEFQVLFGVPMDGRLESLLEKGFKVRIYVPYGPDWFDYSVRRLKENPNIAGYVISNFFKNE